MIWLNPAFTEYFFPESLFADMTGQQGEIYRTGQGRVTLRFECNGQGFFLKRHTGIGWKEVFKDLLQGRLPIVGATNEWKALRKLGELSISSLTPVAFGLRGINPAAQYSFLVTKELENTVSLEELVLDWQTRPDFVAIKRQIIRQVAILARRLHRAGINHRDLYICHLHIARTWLDAPTGEPEISVIDLHRAQIRQQVPVRWQVKDVASLYFSSMEAAMTKRDYLRFIREYKACELRHTLRHEAGFWAQVQTRADRLYATRPVPPDVPVKEQT